MSKQENDVIQAAVAAKLAATRKGEPVAAAAEEPQELPEGVTTIPEYSGKDTKAKLQEVGKICGLDLSETMTKAEMVAAIDKEIADHTVEDDEETAQPAQDATQSDAKETGDKVGASKEKSAQSVSEGKEDAAQLLVAYNGYVNLRREPSTSPDAIAGRVRQGERINAIGTVTADGHTWYKLLGGLYIMGDAGLVEITNK